MSPVPADQGKSISAVMALEIPSLAPDISLWEMPAGSLGIIRNAMGNESSCLVGRQVGKTTQFSYNLVYC